jgi:multidrug efflux pump subunit AcrA (membrane-fusion protein)
VGASAVGSAAVRRRVGPPVPESAPARRRAKRGRRRAIVGILVVVVVLAAGGTAWAMSSGSGPSYRTAEVGRDSVQQVLTTTGTLSPLHSADVDFQVAGTVHRVLAHQGATVVAGQRLATLDRTTLAATLASAKSALSTAEATLADDESGESSSVTSASASTSGTGSATATDTALVLTAATPSPSGRPTPSASPSGTPGGGTPGGGSSGGTVAQDQAAVVAAQHRTDLDLATAKAALKTADAACVSAGSAACTGATTTLLADQTTVSTDEKALLSAEQTLNTAIQKQLSSGQGSTSPSPRASSSSPSGTHSTRSSSGTGTSGSGRTVTAATLASDEARIDSERASVATARGNLAEATLTSPISGHVMAVTISKGDAVSGSSSSTSPAFVIKGSGHDAVTLSLSATQVRTITTGMTASATPDGSSTAVTGHVIAIQAENSSSAYPVVIELADTSSALVSGADAAVTVVLSTAHDVVTAPTSAVHRNGSQTYVEVLQGGKEVRRTVTIGAVGAALTQIKSGLDVGQRVVLADLNAAVPSSSNTLTTRRGGW